MIVASFWVDRPFEFPNAADYPAMLRILQRSCDRLGLRHVVLTDRATISSGLWPSAYDGASIEPIALDLPVPLMKAVTTAQAKWLYQPEARKEPTLFVGADCILLREPTMPRAHMAVTYRNPTARYPINTGSILIAQPHKRVRGLFNEIANACGETWCDDQRAIQAALDPMPATFGNYNRAGLHVAFRPMFPFNHLPASVDDPATGAEMVHFRGKARKQFLFDWAKRWGFA